VAMAGRPSDAPSQRVRFAPVAIATEAGVLAPAAGMIEIELANGTRLRITGPVDAAVVSAAVAAAVRGEQPR
jgi:transposase